MTEDNGAFRKLVVMLSIYFALLFGVVVMVGLFSPDAMSLLPLGGTDALEVLGFDRTEQSFTDQITSAPGLEFSQAPTVTQIASLAVFLATSLIGTLLVMLPVAWTYSAISRDTGYRKSFVRTLLV